MRTTLSVLVLRQFPDLEDRAAHEQYKAQVLREGALVCARARTSNHRPHSLGLSIKMAFGGREDYLIDGRWRSVDDNVYMIINAGHDYSSRIVSLDPVLSVAVMFPQPMVDSALQYLMRSPEHVLESPAERMPAPIFEEHLRPHDPIVSPCLKYIASMCEKGSADDEWYEEQAHFLLERLLRRGHADQVEIERLGKARRRTRLEIYRRVNRASDYLLSCYDQPLTLGTLADVACLAPHYFLHVFKAVRGHTPFEFLTCKRLAVALRLLARGGETTAEIAEQVGFAGRDRLHRACRRYVKTAPAACRKLFAADRDNVTGIPDLRQMLSRDATKSAARSSLGQEHAQRGRAPREIIEP